MAGIESTITHGPVANFAYLFIPPPNEGMTLKFLNSGAQGTLVSDIAGVIEFELIAGMPIINDVVALISPTAGTWSYTVLSDAPSLVTSASAFIHSKLLSNIYSVNLGVGTLQDDRLNEIYNAIYPLAAIGNVLTKILQDTAASFNDWNLEFGNITYGPIFMGTDLPGSKDTNSNWAVLEELQVSNQWTMGDEKLFSDNAGPDDIVTLTRTS